MAAHRKVKVGIQITDEDGGRFPREWLWAEAVHERGGLGGVYCLLNTPFYGPFALGDLVETRRRRNGELIVTGLHRRGGRTSWLLMFALSVPNDQINQLIKQWHASGTWVEPMGGKRVAVAIDAVTGARPTTTEIAWLAASGALDLHMLLAEPADAPDHPVFRNLVA